MEPQFVTYFRLSKESRSGGLGLDAQRQSVNCYLASVKGEVVREFTEIESGGKNDRPELQAAIELCRKTKARLLIAKLDRLARNAAFLLTLRDSGIVFVAADMPTADRLTVAIMAVFAEHEREMIGRRTREALAEAKRRGVKLGNPNPRAAAAVSSKVNRDKADKFARNVFPIIREVQSQGVVSYRGIASALNCRGLRSATNKQFSPQAVSNLIARMNASNTSEVAA